MLNDNVREFLLNRSWLITEEDQEYDRVISDLAIPMDSDFAEFQRFTTESTFSTKKGPELINICWFSIYSDDFEAITDSLWKIGQMEIYHKILSHLVIPMGSLYFYMIKLIKEYTM